MFKKKLKKFSIQNIISIDETSIDSHIENNYGWSKSGKKITITKTHPRIRYTLISAIEYGKVIHSKIIKGSANGEIFLSFMKGLIRKISPNKKYGIILDNARIHHYGKFKTYMNNKPLLDIIYNVPYSPESNPIEKVFNDVKKYLRNVNITNKNICEKINESLSEIKSSNIKSYFKKSYDYY